MRCSSAGLAALTKPYLGWACGWRDFWQSGRNQDFWTANGHVHPQVKPEYLQPLVVFENHGGKFSPAFQFPAVPDNSYRGGSQADFDNDGKLDVVVLPISGQPLLLQNRTVNENNWLGLRIRGTYSNRDAIGAAITLDACGKRQMTPRNGGELYFRQRSSAPFRIGNVCAG